MAKKTFQPEGWTPQGKSLVHKDYTMRVFEDDGEIGLEIQRKGKVVFYGSIPRPADFTFLCKLLNIK